MHAHAELVLVGEWKEGRRSRFRFTQPRVVHYRYPLSELEYMLTPISTDYISLIDCK